MVVGAEVAAICGGSTTTADPGPTPRRPVAARGNGGRHLLWIDPARDLVLCSRWTGKVQRLLATVSAAIIP